MFAVFYYTMLIMVLDLNEIFFIIISWPNKNNYKEELISFKPALDGINVVQRTEFSNVTTQLLVFQHFSGLSRVFCHLMAKQFKSALDLQ